jgi:TldD protein
MPSSTRRQFLTTTLLGVAGTSLGLQKLHASPLHDTVGLSSHPASAFLPDPLASSDLRAMATVAIDAARDAGATYADIRIAEQHYLDLWLSGISPIMPIVQMRSLVNFGIRVIVDGTWAFTHGTIPSNDGIVVAVRKAVTTARRHAQHLSRRVELVPAPVVTGEWETPYQRDPFTVPLEDQAALLAAYRAAALRIRHGSDAQWGAKFEWTRETRVFASSEGSLVTQTFRRSEPFVGGKGNLGMGDWGNGGVELSLPRYGASSGGYETVTLPGMQEDIKALAEEAVHLAELPRRTLDVGRHSVVFDGLTLGTAFGQTIGAALELDRVLGYEAGASGASYLAPPEETLGTHIVNPLFNVKAHRVSPAIGAVKWDDEGVESLPYPLIEEGVLSNYHTSRETAGVLRPWYAQRQQTTRSYGCMVAPDASAPVMVRSPHVTIAPSATVASVDDLCKEVRRGVLVRGTRYVTTDPQFSSGSILSTGQRFEIENGKVVRRLDGNGLEFVTRNFWKSLVALGDASTVANSSFEISKGQPWRSALNTATAPAGLFKDVNVITTKVRI